MLLERVIFSFFIIFTLLSLLLSIKIFDDVLKIESQKFTWDNFSILFPYKKMDLSEYKTINSSNIQLSFGLYKSNNDDTETLLSTSLSQKARAKARNTLSKKLKSKFKMSKHKANKYAEVIVDVSSTERIDPDLMVALIRTESNFDENAISHANAVGPAQIIEKFWLNYCPGNLKEISHNIKCSAKIINKYLKRCNNNLVCALKMYNVGPSNLDKNDYYLKAGKRYITKINKYLKYFSGRTINLTISI